MTTTTDLHQAAAALHQQLAGHPHPADVAGFLSTLPACTQVTGGKDHDEITRRVIALVRGAADVSLWAIELGAADLEPIHAHLWRTPRGEDIAVQIAAGSHLEPAFRRVLTAAVREAVESVYAKYLDQVPRMDIPAAAQ
jgi:hypothetical protein